MDHRLRVVNPSADETEEYGLPPVKMCEECGRFPCPHWFAKVRENNPGLMQHKLTMRRTLWSRWPREERNRARGPVAATAFAVGVLIAGVGINACISGSDPTTSTPPAPYIAILPGTSGPLVPAPTSTGTYAGGWRAHCRPGRGGCRPWIEAGRGRPGDRWR